MLFTSLNDIYVDEDMLIWSTTCLLKRQGFKRFLKNFKSVINLPSVKCQITEEPDILYHGLVKVAFWIVF